MISILNLVITKNDRKLNKIVINRINNINYLCYFNNSITIIIDIHFKKGY